MSRNWRSPGGRARYCMGAIALSCLLFATGTLPAQEIGSSDLPIGARDALEIRVFGLPELSLDTRVRADGTIEVPLVGALAVAGRMVPEVETMIEGRLQGGQFVRDPQVSIFVREMVSRMVSVHGRGANT